MPFMSSGVDLLLRRIQLANLLQFYQEIFQKSNDQGT